MQVIPLSEKEIDNLEKKYGSSFDTNPSVMRNILDYAKNELSCKSAIIEEGYICKDYRSEYSHLYSKAFQDFGSKTTRIHFFQTEINDDSLQTIKNLSDKEYCGYIVIRPILIGKVGRTVIKPAVIDKNRFYYTCLSSNKSNILGKEFSVFGCPFIQQDSMLMCCAHSAIWVATRYMSKVLKFPEVLPHEISENASRSYVLGSRVVPTEGLSDFDIFNCFLNLGYSPVLFSKPHKKDFRDDVAFNEALKHWSPDKNIYRYIESGFPVIVLVPNHTIVAVGHTFKPNRLASGNISSYEPFKTAKIIQSNEWIDGFVIHDDTVGPYRLLPKTKQDDIEYRSEKIERLLPANKQKYMNAEDITGYIVPLPEKVFILSEHIDDVLQGIIEGPLAIRLFWDTNEIAKTGNIMAQEFIKSMVDDKVNPLVIRSYITESTKYKEKLSNLGQDDVPMVLKESLLRLPMPHFIWVNEITNVENMSKVNHVERKIYGQIILDATGNKFALPWLAVHFPGQLYTPSHLRNPEHKLIIIENDFPQKMTTRQSVEC